MIFLFQLFGMYILGFYSKVQYDKYHCRWAQGIKSCDFFINESSE